MRFYLFPSRSQIAWVLALLILPLMRPAHADDYRANIQSLLGQARDLALVKKEYWADEALEWIALAQAKAGQRVDAEKTITLIGSARRDQAWVQ